MRLINHKDFEPGPFNLGRLGPVVGVIACLWITFITASLLKLCSRRSLLRQCRGAHPSAASPMVARVFDVSLRPATLHCNMLMILLGMGA